MPGFDQLVSALQRPDVPRDERIDLNAEVLNQFIKSLEFPDREEVEAYLPTLSKASTLEPFFEQYVIGNRRTPTHTAILYLNEYGVIDRGDGTSRYLEKPSIGGFRFLKERHRKGPAPWHGGCARRRPGVVAQRAAEATRLCRRTWARPFRPTCAAGR